MTRPKVPPRRVEALANECRALLHWLKGPGSSADPEAFDVVLRAYRALIEALNMLPHGSRYLNHVRALPPTKKPYPFAKVERTAESFSPDELALLDKPVLTLDGVVVPASLLAHVEKEGAANDKAALAAILTRVALQRGVSSSQTLTSELGKLQVRVSRQRTTKRITKGPKKMPPKGA